MLELDHLIIGAQSLEAGVEYVRDRLGVTMPKGGAHPLMGTHNHLMLLGGGVYLEVIAPDTTVMPRRVRWFGLDYVARAPKLIGWVARTDDIERAMRDIDGAKGEIITMTRGDLEWRINVPRDGSLSMDGAFPTLIQWPDWRAPQSRMADLGCRLTAFEISHPEGERISRALASVLKDERIAIQTGKYSLRASIMTRFGPRDLV
jgi:hypothetical protein